METFNKIADVVFIVPVIKKGKHLKAHVYHCNIPHL